MARRKVKKPTRVYARRRDPNEDDDSAPPQYDVKWWKADDSQNAVSALWSWIDRLRGRWSSDGMMDLIHEAIYRGRPLGGNQANAGTFLLLRSGTLLNLNVIMSMVDTATARLTKRRPMPMISADDAGWSEKGFAKRNSRILRRKMGSTPIERMSPRVIRDMCIRGDGCAKVFRDGGDVGIKRIPIYEIVVDPFEAEHGEPTQMVHVRPEPRDKLCALYPAYKEQISEAPSYSRADQWSTYAYQGAQMADYIEVAEAWHPPSIPGAEDGQHIVTIKGCVIERGPWADAEFPIARTQWSPPTRGWRGSGLVEQLAGIQEQINDILRDAREGLKNGSQLTVFVQRGANVNKHHLRARHPKVVEYDGVEPHFVAPNPVSEQAIRILLMLIEQAYQITGISQMSAQSKNTLGANASGKAIDTMDDIQSDRFAHVESDYMMFRCQLGTLVINEARRMYLEAYGKNDDADEDDAFDECPVPIAKADLAPWIKNGEWDKIEVDGGTYHLTIEPVNFLADSRGGKLSQVNELGKAGLIPDPSMQADLFDEPDISRANRTILGPKHCLDAIMSGLADPSVPMIDLQPDRYMNLPLGILMAKGELNEAMSDMMGKADQPEEILERYREWIESAKGVLKGTAGVDSAVGPQGMMAANMGAQQSAASLQPGLMPAPGAPPGMGAPPGPPMGMAA